MQCRLLSEAKLLIIRFTRSSKESFLNELFISQKGKVSGTKYPLNLICKGCRTFVLSRKAKAFLQSIVSPFSILGYNRSVSRLPRLLSRLPTASRVLKRRRVQMVKVVGFGDLLDGNGVLRVWFCLVIAVGLANGWDGEGEAFGQKTLFWLKVGGVVWIRQLSRRQGRERHLFLSITVFIAIYPFLLQNRCGGYRSRTDHLLHAMHPRFLPR
jgi:hypothetical protein